MSRENTKTRKFPIGRIGSVPTQKSYQYTAKVATAHALIPRLKIMVGKAQRAKELQKGANIFLVYTLLVQLQSYK